MAQGNVHSQTFNIKFKQGVAANINTTATKNLAVEGEPHWTTDTDKLWMYDGNNNIRVHGLDNALVDGNGDIITEGGEILWLS